MFANEIHLKMLTNNFIVYLVTEMLHFQNFIYVLSLKTSIKNEFYFLRNKTYAKAIPFVLKSGNVELKLQIY